MTLKKVLIVDDAQFMRKKLRSCLENTGKYEVVGEAENGLLAVENYKKLKPDVVTMDIIMPEMDGIDAVKKILEFDPNARILMVSSVGLEQNIQEATKAGAKNFILKPFENETFLDVLDGVAR